MKILVVGAGYVGLVTGACFAEMGHHVLCLDIDQEKIHNLKNGLLPIYEPGLEEIIKRASEAGRLQFTTSYTEGVPFGDICFLAVSTPSLPDGRCDVSYVGQAAYEIGLHMDKSKIIVNKSTVPMGTCHDVHAIIADTLKQRGCLFTCTVVSNPEFLKEGDAVNDFLKPDRIVIGTNDPKAAAIMCELYAPFNLNHERVLLMDPLSAEMTKYAANAMLASRISFMNEMASLCEQLGADISKVRLGIGADKRIGYSFLYAGAGYGGSCFPKDIKALRATARQEGCPTPLLDAIEEVNEKQKRKLGKKVIDYFAAREPLFGQSIAVWGLSFKPGTDDIRDAPSLSLIRSLLEAGAHLRLYDPVAMKRAKEMFKLSPQLHFCKDEYEAAEGVAAIVLVTEWKQFRFVDFKRILSQMKGRAFFDGRNQYQREEMAALGFDYFSIGQPQAALCSTGNT